MRTQDDDGVILETFSYEYDRNSQIIEETHVNNLPEEAERINETTGYTYDNFGRLTQSAKTDYKKSNAQSVTVYGYDNVGNRISMVENGVETTYTYNSLNQLLSLAENGETTTYTYDGRGNQITETKDNVVTESTYSVRGEMLTLTKKNGDDILSNQENQYNYDGIRISKKEDGVTRRYYYDNGVIAYTKDGTTLSSANVTGPEGQVVGTFRGGDYHVYLKDIQGSTTNIVKQDGSLSAAYEYSDFGETEEITGSSFDNEICYTGAIYDDTTGLYYMNARYYEPENGRFISQDTYRGELNNPAQWHLYAYCANNPINYVDPSGHSPVGKKLNLADYRIIHNKVADLVAWSLCAWGGLREVYCKGPKGKGFLDVYDIYNNAYYEIKSRSASKKTATKRQMEKYDVAKTRYNSKKIHRSGAYVRGSFYYGVWEVEYWKVKAGLVAYDTSWVESRYKKFKKAVTIAQISIIAVSAFATGGATAPSSIPYFVLAI